MHLASWAGSLNQQISNCFLKKIQNWVRKRSGSDDQNVFKSIAAVQVASPGVSQKASAGNIKRRKECSYNACLLVLGTKDTLFPSVRKLSPLKPGVQEGGSAISALHREATSCADNDSPSEKLQENTRVNATEA